MPTLSTNHIEKIIADSEIIYQRGQKLYEYGSFCCVEANFSEGEFEYEIDGNYGDYKTTVTIDDDGIFTDCDCPYPGIGCKHTVAVLLDIRDKVKMWGDAAAPILPVEEAPPETPYLNADEIRNQALEDRLKRAKKESFEIEYGDMFKGKHELITDKGKRYTVTIHDPENGYGHCDCPDFVTNRLNTCKHIIFLSDNIKNKRGYKKRIKEETFPFVDIFWDSREIKPRLFTELPENKLKDIKNILSDYFDENGFFLDDDASTFADFIIAIEGHKRVRISKAVFSNVEKHLNENEFKKLSTEHHPSFSIVKTQLYPYQEEGVNFSIFKPAVLIGDEMGLGKTLQAITAAILKKQIFSFSKALVITLASLKEQWKREIEKFSDEHAVVISGNAKKREELYTNDTGLFKITNYEAVLRDVSVISAFKPDLIILDEAQRIKNFETKTAEAVKNLPRIHAMVLTGTPLENKLEDVYSIVQFLDKDLLMPLWKFAADHFMLSREKKGKILGYRNLDMLHEKLKKIAIRRRKEEVLSDLPDEVENNYYIELTEKQHKIHSGFAQSLLPIINKKFLTPMDLRRIQVLLLKMRMVCNSTYLIDRKTNVSPKLKELQGIVDEMVVQNNRKMVIFSEWTTMTYLIAKQLSDARIPFVELSGKIPVHKRQALIDEFSNNPECKVFLSTDAGGTGLNLQAADCVVNFELPWNPAKMNQRIGRVNRIGQESNCVNVINLIAKDCIEERIYAGIQMKTDLFKGVFDGGESVVEFSNEKKTALLNRLRDMLEEEDIQPQAEARSQEELPEDTPHYLNPEVLKKDEETQIAYDAEEIPNTSSPNESANEHQAGNDTEESFIANQPPEKIESVLNQGMMFVSGLLEMATGKKVEPTGSDDKLIKIDQETGEVTMKFKLPGF